MEPMLVTSITVDKPGVLTLRGPGNPRHPWAPTPRVVVDVHTICWYTIGTPFGRRIINGVTLTMPDGEQLTTDEGYVVPFTIGTSFGAIVFHVPVSAVVRGEYVPQNTALISELLHQFNGVL